MHAFGAASMLFTLLIEFGQILLKDFKRQIRLTISSKNTVLRSILIFGRFAIRSIQDSGLLASVTRGLTEAADTGFWLCGMG